MFYFIYLFLQKKNYFTHNILKKKKIVGEIANKSIEHIYPNDGTLKETAARYSVKKYPELFEDWGDKRWTHYYEQIKGKVSFTEYIII